MRGIFGRTPHRGGENEKETLYHSKKEGAGPALTDQLDRVPLLAPHIRQTTPAVRGHGG